MAEPASQSLPVGERPGDEVFGRQLAAMQPRIRAFLRNLRSGDTDDLVQETMTRAWRSRASYAPGRGALHGWVLRIAFRTFLDERQRAARTPASLAQEAADGGRGPAERVTSRDELGALLDRLGPVERTVILKFHGDGHSIAAIARQLAMPEGTVKSHLHRARARLWAAERAGRAGGEA